MYVTFHIGSKKIEIPVKYSVSPFDFDKKKKRVKPSFQFHADVNLIITNIISRANDIFVKYRLRDMNLTESDFWCEYRNPSDFKSFFDFCERSQQLRFQELASGTQRHHRSSINLLSKGDTRFEYFKISFRSFEH